MSSTTSDSAEDARPLSLVQELERLKRDLALRRRREEVTEVAEFLESDLRRWT